MLPTSLHSNTDQEKLVKFTVVWDVKPLTWQKLKMQKEAGFPSRMMEIFCRTVFTLLRLQKFLHSPSREQQLRQNINIPLQ